MNPVRSPTERAPATAAVVDGCLRQEIPFKLAPSRLLPLFQHDAIAGPSLAVKHAGSVDVFLEAFNNPPGARSWSSTTTDSRTRAASATSPPSRRSTPASKAP